MAFSAFYILVESFGKLVNPQPLTQLPWLTAAALIGFAGNELVALMQIRVGRRIGSAAMLADGQHARADGLTSLAVLGSVLGSLIGVPVLDPLIGLVIGLTIVGITMRAAKTVWDRLLDAVDPALIDTLDYAVRQVDGVRQVQRLRARWVGHQLMADVVLVVDASHSMAENDQLRAVVRAALKQAAPRLRDSTIELISA
jgi:cation diffusion facilitator family transporter